MTPGAMASRPRRLAAWTRRSRRFLRSRAALSVLKGVLANVLVYVTILSDAIQSRFEHPLVLRLVGLSSPG